MAEITFPVPDIDIVILAAGASRRLGKAKQLIVWHGETLIERCVRIATSLSRSVYVVLGARAEQIMQHFNTSGIEVIHNPHWREGMSSSLKAGLRASENNGKEVRAVLFLLVDQPLLEEKHLKTMVRKYALDGCGIIASDYGGKEGVPALFDRKYFPELLALKGDQGARPLLLKYADILCLLPFPGGKVDLDTPDDLDGFFQT